MVWYNFIDVLSRTLHRFWLQLLSSQGKQLFFVDKGMSKSLGAYKAKIH
jgi:hypothetical protein